MVPSEPPAMYPKLPNHISLSPLGTAAEQFVALQINGKKFLPFYLDKGLYMSGPPYPFVEMYGAHTMTVLRGGAVSFTSLKSITVWWPPLYVDSYKSVMRTLTLDARYWIR